MLALGALCLLVFLYLRHTGSSLKLRREEGAYGDDSRTSKFVLYRPEKAKKALPLVIFVHGGAFVQGSCTDYIPESFAKDIGRAGFIAATIEYPKIRDNYLEAFRLKELEMKAVAAAKKAAYYFIDHADEYGVDKNNIFICGYSAGAVIALHSLFSDAEEAERYAGSSLAEGIKAVLDQPNPFRGIVAISGGLLTMDCVDDDDFKCPILLFHSETDSVFPYYYGRPFAAVAEKPRHFSLPRLSFILGIGSKGRLIDIDPSIIVPRSIMRFLRNWATNGQEVYGSGAIYEQYGNLDFCDIRLVKLQGPHQCFIKMDGRISKNYRKVRRIMLRFIKRNVHEE